MSTELVSSWATVQEPLTLGTPGLDEISNCLWKLKSVEDRNNTHYIRIRKNYTVSVTKIDFKSQCTSYTIHFRPVMTEILTPYQFAISYTFSFS